MGRFVGVDCVRFGVQYMDALFFFFFFGCELIGR